MDVPGQRQQCCSRFISFMNTENSNGVFIFSLPVSVLLGLQYVIIALLFVIHLPLKGLTHFCLLPDDPERGSIFSKVLFVSGVATLTQSLFGARSPISITPSIIFISIASDYFKSNLWEKYTDGDLYAMGPVLRRNEFILRTAEVQGMMILSSFVSAIIYGSLWYFRIRMPPSTIQATLISAAISNIIQILKNADEVLFEKALLFQLAIGLLILFFIAQNINVPYLKVISSEDHKIHLKIFKLFAVLLTFFICLFININFELDYDSLLERAAEPHSWLSFEFIPQDFNFPVISLRALIFFPTFLSQSLVSYCCYTLIIKNTVRELLAFLLECSYNVLSPALGIFLPLSVEPASLGLWSQTEVRNYECTMISGSLFIVMSSFLRVVAFSSYAPYSLLSGIVIFLYGQLICRVMMGSKDNTEVNFRIIGTSVICGLMLSSFSPELDENIYYTILTIFLKSPVLLSFLFSLLFILPYKNIISSKHISVNPPIT